MSEVRIVLQARLSSRRLPAKCLLPIGGLPLAALTALRAANTGIPIALATSVEAEDDGLVQLAEAYGISFFRGHLDDVFARFMLATKDLPDDAWIVRLTADNCFPDGHFVNDLVQQAEKAQVDYLGTSSPADGLPYGLSAEVFRAGAMRAVKHELTAFDREHVTPAIKRRFGMNLASFGNRNESHLRCTVDTRTDYFRLRNLFARVEDPINISWETLCEQLAAEPGSPAFRIPWKSHEHGIVGRITLGTAQLGLERYGRTNQSGMPSSEETFQLLDTAVRHGVTHFDTARAYGQAEARVGEALRFGLYAEPVIVTKLDPMAELGDGASYCEVSKWVEASVFQSLHTLGCRALPILMMHRWAHYNSHSGAVWKTLTDLKQSGVISELGASVYTPQEAAEALKEPLVKHLQIPYNLLDHRWRSENFQKARSDRPDVLVYARSAYLQGLLVSDPDFWPVREGFAPGDIVNCLDSLVQQLGRRSRADLCLAYLNASKFIDSIVMGLESMSQLEENLLLASCPALTDDEVRIVEKRVPIVPEWLLDPSQWS